MLPKGFTKIPSYEVFVNDDDLIVLGDAPENEDEEAGHNCDAMGCGWDHVIARCKVVSLGVELPEPPSDLTPACTSDSAVARGEQALNCYQWLLTKMRGWANPPSR